MKKEQNIKPKGELHYYSPDIPITLSHRKIYPDMKHEELLHWHDEVELIRIRRGKIHCHVNDSDFLLQENELCCINLNQLHRIYNVEHSAGEIDVLIINTGMLSLNPAVYNKYVKSVIDDQNFSHIRLNGRNSGAKIISDFYDVLFELLEQKPEGYELDIIGYIHMIFRRLYLAHNADTELTIYNSDTEIQRRMTAFIYENYKEKISLDEIAGAGGVSRSKCAVLFQKYAQKTPIEYLNSYRLEMSNKLMQETEMPISDIALECGFSDQSYFTKQYKKEYGFTPAAYKKGNINEEAFAGRGEGEPVTV